MMDLDSHPFKCLISTNLSRGFRVTRSPSRREHLELCEWWGNLPPRSCWPRSQAEVQKEHTELGKIADCPTFICMFFLHMKLFNMDHFISFEMFGNPYKQISLGQMVNRFWRMLKWLSICLFFNIWVSKHVNVFLLRGPRFNHQKYIIDLRGRAHRHQVEQVPLEQRCPQRPGALRTTSGWLVACNGCTSGASSCARALVPEAQRGQRKTCERPIVAGFDVSMSRNVETHVEITAKLLCINCQTTSWLPLIPGSSRKLYCGSITTCIGIHNLPPSGWGC